MSLWPQFVSLLNYNYLKSEFVAYDTQNIQNKGTRMRSALVKQIFKEILEEFSTSWSSSKSETTRVTIVESNDVSSTSLPSGG